MGIIKIKPDKEKARSILKMTSLIEERITKQDASKMAALILSDYYEIIKELITAILLVDGYKTLSHKDLVEYIKINYKEFTMQEISFLDNLRILRNRIAYEGFFVEPSYLERNEKLAKGLIAKLRNILESRLEQ